MTFHRVTAAAAVVLLAQLGGYTPGRVFAQGGCTPFGSGFVTVIGSTTTVRPTDTVCGSTTAQVTAARNEFESFQVVFRAGGTALNAVAVSASGLTGPNGSIPAANVTVYRVGLYTAQIASDAEGGTGRWPDALIPAVDPWFGEQRNAFPVNVPAGENRIAWIDVFVPQGTPPGTYSGTVTVADAGTTVQVPVSLKVISATLPSTSSLENSFSTNYRAPCDAHTGHFACNWDEAQRWRLQSLYAQAALDNRITLSNPMPLGNNQSPTAADAARFRTYILPLLNSSAAFHEQWKPLRLQGAELTSFNLHWDCGAACLAGWRQLAVTAPTFDDKAFLYCTDEPHSSVTLWDRCRTSRSNAAQGWPTLPLLTTATIQDTTAAGMDTSIDILVPIINRMHDKEAGGHECCKGDQRAKYNDYLATAGNRLWMYTSNMSFSSDESQYAYWDGWAGYAIDQPASQSRAMGWLSFTYDVTGELYWETTNQLSNAWQPGGLYTQGGNGDGTLFYPGTPAAIGGQSHIPVESIRMKRIRDGREDYEYLRLVSAKGHGDFARTVARQLFPSTHQTTVTQQALDAARASLITKLDTGTTVTAPPAAPVTTAPVGTTEQARPFLYWRPSDTATHYVVWINDSTGHKGSYTEDHYTLTCGSLRNECEFLPPVDLAFGHVHFWVKARNAAGDSPWSAVQSFIRATSTPRVDMLAVSSVAPTAAGGTARLWAQVQNMSNANLPADTKIWFYASGPGWSGSPWVGAGPAAGLAPGAKTWVSFDWKIPLNAQAGTYTYWAQAYAPSAISGWSGGQTFTVNATTVALSITAVYPPGSVTRGGTAVLWARVRNNGTSAPPAGTKVWFWVNGPGWTGSHWVGGTLAESIAAGTDQWIAFRWQVPASIQPGTYTYWAQVWTAAGAVTPWSAGQTFITQ